MKKPVRVLLWCLPWLLHSVSAHAWGLYTHVFFAQWLIWGVPLLDGELRRAVTRHPRLVLAGACLPDLALVGRLAGTRAFDRTHCWENARQMLAGAQDDEERALVVGFYSHLFADVVAHHHFVPAHERLWVDWPMVAHTISEWSMDAHVRPQVADTPAGLLHEGEAVIVRLVSRHFLLESDQARRSVRMLAHADRLLRGLRLPQWLYRAVMSADRRVPRRFDYFIAETGTRFADINRVFAGDMPSLDANGGCARAAQARLAQFSDQQIGLGQPLPSDCFYSSHPA